MRRLGAGLLAALLTFAGAASAQEAGQPGAREHADAIIAEAGAADLFSNVTTDDKRAVVRHDATGLECAFTPGGNGKITVITAVLPRGEDVACNMPVGDVSVTFYATRRPGASVKQELGGASDVIKLRWPDARKYRPVGVAKQMFPTLTAPKTIHQDTNWFTVEDQGRAAVTRVSVAVAGDWVIKLRATGPAPDVAGRLELLTDVLWNGALMDVEKGAAGPPV